MVRLEECPLSNAATAGLAVQEHSALFTFCFVVIVRSVVMIIIASDLRRAHAYLRMREVFSATGTAPRLCYPLMNETRVRAKLFTVLVWAIPCSEGAVSPKRSL